MKYPLPAIIVILCVRLVGADPIRVSTGFPGGHGKVLSIDQATTTVRIQPGKQPNGGWACWWSIKIGGLRKAAKLRLQVTGSRWAQPLRAAFSTDQRQWVQTNPAVTQGGVATYEIATKSTDLHVAWGPPFLQHHVDEMWQRVKRLGPTRVRVRREILSQSRGGRPVHGFWMPATKKRRHGIWIQARQHAWEVGSSWVSAGIFHWLLSGDSQAEALREHAAIMIVPIVDVDSVELGLGGKEQRPRDHNRDWTGRPHWPYVAATTKRLRRWDRLDQLDLFLDLHNPGPTAIRPFYMTPPRMRLSPVGRRQLDRFLTACRVSGRSAFSFRGQAFESGASYDPRWKTIAKNWVALNCRPKVVAVTLETPWNTRHSTITGYKSAGRELGVAIQRYFAKP